MTDDQQGNDAERTSAADDGQSATPDSATKMTAREEAIDLAKTVAIAVAIAVVLRIAIFQPFNIPSGSMKPNLLVGDFLFVSKPAYGYSRASLIYPFTRVGVEGRILEREPKRGDVIVFKNRIDGNKDYIKRLIGLPGDKVEMIDGRLYINDRPVEKEYVGLSPASCDGRRAREVPMYRETLPNGVTYYVQECDGDNGRSDDVGPFLVPAGRYFFMGDNRDESQDSRTAGVGYVPFDDVVGRAERLFFSVDGEKARIWEFWKWPVAIRYGRVFDKVE